MTTLSFSTSRMTLMCRLPRSLMSACLSCFLMGPKEGAIFLQRIYRSVCTSTAHSWLQFRTSGFCPLMTTFACGNPVRITCAASQCWSLTAQHPSLPLTPFFSGPSTLSMVCAVAVHLASLVTIVRLRLTCAILTPVATTGTAEAEKEDIHANAKRAIQVSLSYKHNLESGF